MSDATRIPQFPLRASKPGLDGDIDPIHPTDPDPTSTDEASDTPDDHSHKGPRHSTKTKD